MKGLPRWILLLKRKTAKTASPHLLCCVQPEGEEATGWYAVLRPQRDGFNAGLLELARRAEAKR